MINIDQHKEVPNKDLLPPVFDSRQEEIFAMLILFHTHGLVLMKNPSGEYEIYQKLMR